MTRPTPDQTVHRIAGLLSTIPFVPARRHPSDLTGYARQAAGIALAGGPPAAPSDYQHPVWWCTTHHAPCLSTGRLHCPREGRPGACTPNRCLVVAPPRDNAVPDLEDTE